MNIEDVKKAFGSGKKACDALGISDRNWTRWVREDLIPLKHQMTFSEIKPELQVMDSIDYAKKSSERIKNRHNEGL